MPTNTHVNELKINRLTEAQYDAAVQAGIIGENELSIITDMSAGDTIQVDTMPTAAASELGKIYQFIGTTDANYTNGYFYKCVSDGQNPATYSWTQTNVQPSAIKHKYTVTLEMVQGETMTTAFYMRGAAGKTTNLNITQFMSYETGGVWDDPYFDGQYIGFLKSGADGISASKIVALNTETNNLGFNVYATDDNDEPIIEFVADYVPSYVTEDSVKVIFEIESDEPLVEVETSGYGEYLGEICITQAVPYLSLTAPSGADQDYVLQNTNGERISWVAAPSGLPSQTGQSGKFLTTDGTDASWATVSAGQTIQYDTMPTASAEYLGKIIQYTGTTSGSYRQGCFYIGSSYQSGGQTVYNWSIVTPVPGLSTSGNATIVGGSASARMYGTAIGYMATAGSYAICIGNPGGGVSLSATTNAIAIGGNATGNGAVQIGYGTNSAGGTLQFYSYPLVDSVGKIPADRLPNAINKYSTMPTAASGKLGWIVQYTGTTDANYTHGYIYECVSDGQNPTTYSWSAINVQAGGGSVPTLTWYTVSTAGTTLTIADTSSAQLVKVYKNGLLLQPTEDYTISGTTLTTVTAMTVGDKITTEVF